MPDGPNGVVVVDKPGGMTSHDVVNRLRRLYGTKRVGHTGTLDPLATGVLVICLGHATRIVEYLTASEKEYVAGVAFGVTTDSEDVTGSVLTEVDSSALTRDALEAALPRFRGRITQVPPMVSAVHHEGQRLYELARKGIEVERQARPVEVHALELLDFTPGEQARATLRIVCSTGTYIRTLAADIGKALAVGGMMETLRRIRSGAMTLQDAWTLEALAERKEAGGLAGTLLTIPEALRDWPQLRLSAVERERITQGQTIPWDGVEQGALTLLLGPDGQAAGIGRGQGRTVQPVKVFAQS